MLPCQELSMYPAFCFDIYEIQQAYSLQRRSVTFPTEVLPWPIPSFLHDIVIPINHMFHIVPITNDLRQSLRGELVSAGFYKRRSSSHALTLQDRLELADFIHLVFNISSLVLMRLDIESNYSTESTLDSIEDVSSNYRTDISNCMSGG